jgi:guanylate kinase
VDYLFIIGPSGSGKTTLSRKLEKFAPDKYKRIVQNTTREMRTNEINGRDYNFLSDIVYNTALKDGIMTAVVEKEFYPYRYGTYYKLLNEDKTNILIASLEGLIDAVNKLKEEDRGNILFISHVKNPEVKRDGRYYSEEEKYSSIVINKLYKNSDKKNINVIEIFHEDLKQIRNDKDRLLPFLDKRLLK